MLNALRNTLDGTRVSRYLVNPRPYYFATDLQIATAFLRPSADFVIFGCQKGGTTSMYEYLSAVPGIRRCSRKEFHFFDHLMKHATPRWSDRLYYRALFPLTRQIVGESSPYYLYHPLAASRAAAIVPTARIIVLLRDPVTRAYSHYHHERREGREELSFEDALRAEPERLAGEEERLTADPSYHSFEHTHHSYASRGEYARQLERLYAHFPREQVLILDSHEFSKDRRGTLGLVLEFLGLDRELASRVDVSRESLKGDYEPMRPQTREQLRVRFAPHDEELRRLLARELSWMR